MIEVERRSIVHPRTETIICPATGSGVMPSGVAKDIKRIAGEKLQQEAMALVKSNGKLFDVGSYFCTMPYRLSRRGVKKVYHAVVMPFPGGIGSTDFVFKSVDKILQRALVDGIKSIAIPCLDCNIDKTSIARITVSAIKIYSGSISIRFVDTDEEFINTVGNLI